ncbi:MAG: oligopeptide/dipeptide ABC transporter ATP-binding protein [Devosia sp.]
MDGARHAIVIGRWPILGANPTIERQRETTVLLGDLPSPLAPPSGCRFRTRCTRVMDICVDVPPADVRLHDRTVACHLIDPAVAAMREGTVQYMPPKA